MAGSVNTSGKVKREPAQIPLIQSEAEGVIQQDLWHRKSLRIEFDANVLDFSKLHVFWYLI